MTIGPAPMMRMLLRSVRLGMSVSAPSARRSGRTGSRCRAARATPRGGPGSRTPACRCAPGPAACRRTGTRASAAALPAAIFSSTAKPWFWLVMLTRPLSRSFTGWLAPWWPNFILKVLAPEASARIWWPRQMPKVGQAAVDQLARRRDRVVAGLGVARAVAQEDAIGRQRQHLGRRRLRRHHGDAAAAAGQHAQDVALDAEVVGHDVKARRRPARRSRRRAPTRSRVHS